MLIQGENYKLYNGDCLEIMKDIPDKSVDMILCDLPYGTTKNKWDIIIPFDALWEQYNRIITDNGAIVLFAQGMFTSDLMQSNKKMWRYNLIWDKVLKTGFLNANRMPLRQHEDICIFYKKLPIYNPQKFEGKKASHSSGSKSEYQNNNYGKFENVDNSKLHGKMKFPASILSFEKPHPSISCHPTQKPVELCEWLIRTYTNENMTILDNCMGSGTTGVATINVGGNRKFIGIELDEKYFNISCERLKNVN